MDKLIYTAMTGSKWLLERQASIAHNLANVTTDGYKAEVHRLRAVQIQSESLPTRAFSVDTSIGNDFSEGPVVSTGNTLDMAVVGQGWIALSLPDGTEAYTRNGSFKLDPSGVLQTRNGVPVAADGGTISIPPDNKISIAQDGTVSVSPSSGAQNTVVQVGTIKLVNPPEADLVRGADGLFRLKSGGTAAVDPSVKIAQGYVEGSNVNVVDQLVAMIATARQFEIQTKLLQNAEADDRAAQQLLAAAR